MIVLHEPVLDIDGRRCEVIINTPDDTREEFRPDPDGAAIEEYCGLLPEEHADAETVEAVIAALYGAADDLAGSTIPNMANGSRGERLVLDALLRRSGLEDYRG